MYFRLRDFLKKASVIPAPEPEFGLDSLIKSEDDKGRKSESTLGAEFSIPDFPRSEIRMRSIEEITADLEEGQMHADKIQWQIEEIVRKDPELNGFWLTGFPLIVTLMMTPFIFFTVALLLPSLKKNSTLSVTAMMDSVLLSALMGIRKRILLEKIKEHPGIQKAQKQREELNEVLGELEEEFEEVSRDRSELRSKTPEDRDGEDMQGPTPEERDLFKFEQEKDANNVAKEQALKMMSEMLKSNNYYQNVKKALEVAYQFLFDDNEWRHQIIKVAIIQHIGEGESSLDWQKLRYEDFLELPNYLPEDVQQGAKELAELYAFMYQVRHAQIEGRKPEPVREEEPENQIEPKLTPAIEQKPEAELPAGPVLEKKSEFAQVIETETTEEAQSDRRAEEKPEVENEVAGSENDAKPKPAQEFLESVQETQAEEDLTKDRQRDAEETQLRRTALKLSLDAAKTDYPNDPRKQLGALFRALRLTANIFSYDILYVAFEGVFDREIKPLSSDRLLYVIEDGKKIDARHLHGMRPFEFYERVASFIARAYENDDRMSDKEVSTLLKNAIRAVFEIEKDKVSTPRLSTEMSDLFVAPTESVPIRIVIAFRRIPRLDGGALKKQRETSEWAMNRLIKRASSQFNIKSIDYVIGADELKKRVNDGPIDLLVISSSIEAAPEFGPIREHFSLTNSHGTILVGAWSTITIQAVREWWIKQQSTAITASVETELQQPMGAAVTQTDQKKSARSIESNKEAVIPIRFVFAALASHTYTDAIRIEQRNATRNILQNRLRYMDSRIQLQEPAYLIGIEALQELARSGEGDVLVISNTLEALPGAREAIAQFLKSNPKAMYITGNVKSVSEVVLQAWWNRRQSTVELTEDQDPILDRPFAELAGLDGRVLKALIQHGKEYPNENTLTRLLEKYPNDSALVNNVRGLQHRSIDRLNHFLAQNDKPQILRSEQRVFVEDAVRRLFSRANVPFRDEHQHTTIGVFRPTLSVFVEPLVNLAQSSGPIRIIDMGSGQGSMVFAFAMWNHFAQVLGIEFVQDLYDESLQVRKAMSKENKERVRFERGDFNDPKYADEIQQADLINYWENGTGNETKLFQTLTRNMKPGAKFLVIKTHGRFIQEIKASGYYEIKESPMDDISVFVRNEKLYEEISVDTEGVRSELRTDNIAPDGRSLKEDFDQSVAPWVSEVVSDVGSSDLVILLPIYNEISEIASKYGVRLEGTHGQVIDARVLAETLQQSAKRYLEESGKERAVILVVGETKGELAQRVVRSMQEKAHELESDSVRIKVYGKEERFAGLKGKQWALRAGFNVAEKLGSDFMTIDSDMQIEEDYVSTMMSPIKDQKVDYVSPVFMRYFGRDDVSIISLFNSPLFSAFFGQKLQMPNEGGFAVSNALLKTFLSEEELWQGGIPFEEQFPALTLGHGGSVGEVWLGEKRHKVGPIEENLETYLNVAVGSFFSQFKNHPEWWKNRSQSVDVDLSTMAVIPDDVLKKDAKSMVVDGIDLKKWFESSQGAHRRQKLNYGEVIPHVADLVQQIMSQELEPFEFSSEDWAKIVIEFIRVFLESGEDEISTKEITELLKPLFMARVIAFVKEVEKIETFRQVQELLDVQTRAFAEAKVEAFRSELRKVEADSAKLFEQRQKAAAGMIELLDHPQRRGTLAMSVDSLGQISQEMRDELLAAISERKEVKLILYGDSPDIDFESAKWRDQFASLTNVIAVPNGRNEALERWGLQDSVAVDLSLDDELIDTWFAPGQRIKKLKHVRLKKGNLLMAKLIATVPEEQLWWIHEVNSFMEMLPGFRSELRAFVASKAIAWSA